jgi:hypothetical protein
MSIAPDKKLHLYAGLLIGAVFTVVFKNPGAGVLAGIVIGLGKEYIYDAGINYLNSHKGLPPAHDVDIYDALYTIAGSVGSSGVVGLIVDRLV